MKQNTNTTVTILLWTGIALLAASYVLPAVQGHAAADVTLQGWEVALFILSGMLNFMHGELELLLAGLFLCNGVLYLGIALLLLKWRVPAWYLPTLAVALLYVLGFTFLNFGFGQLGSGFFAYLCAYLLLGAACILARGTRETAAAQSGPVSE